MENSQKNELIMPDETKTLQIFENGANWLRADFHLHTRQDKEFHYNGQENDFLNLYIDKLKEQKIRLGVITNHNKFVKDEYTALARKARREEIYILPGIELSVADGANGIHTLVVFDPEQWLNNGVDFINQFITKTFAGKSNYGHDNSRSNHSLLATIDVLNKFDKNYFMIMAHIGQDGGFKEELGGGRIQDLAREQSFRDAVLGFQKICKSDEEHLKIWFDHKLPAFVEGSDPKNPDEIGKGGKTYLKLGAFNFDAVKFALIDAAYRVKKAIPIPNQSYIKSISFDTGKQDTKCIHLNSAMNNLIGIRGSGKSSILETIRYALDIGLNDTNIDKKYKEDLVVHFLGSGGKTRLEIVEHTGKLIVAEKILGDRTNIYLDGVLTPGLKISGILKKPLYFGQKDLSGIKGSTNIENLVNQLIGEKVKLPRQEIEEKNSKIIAILNEIFRLNKLLAQKPELEAKRAALDHKLKIFKDYDIDKKLNRQIEFDKDAGRIRIIKDFEQQIVVKLEEFISEFNHDFKSYLDYQSKENVDLFTNINKTFSNFTILFNRISDILTGMKHENTDLDAIEKEFLQRYEDLKEEFAKIKRDINLPYIQADDYVKFIKELETTRLKLDELDKTKNKLSLQQDQLLTNLIELQTLWNNEYTLINKEIEKINADQSSIRIIMKFKGDKENFKEFLKDNIRGTGIRETSIQTIVDNYSDLIETYRDLTEPAASGKLNEILPGGTQYNSFKARFEENLGTFLTYRVPDFFEILYKDKPLAEHSLGQRASALINFLLSLKENDIIIIDQPEDDLDSQTIYDDVIHLLCNLKMKTQFIFATHNPNIPVLGDCEQVISCRYEQNKVSILTGSTDDTRIRKDIVSIMEGGNEAFERRKIIYQLWKQ
jgi:predicted ATPase